MGFRAGSLTVRRYAVLGEVPESLARTATNSLKRYVFKPIDDSRGEKESFGWVNPRRFLDKSFAWEDLVDGHLAFMALRRDRKSFSPVLFRARRDERIERIRTEKKIAKISRQQRLALEEELTVEMLKETSPQSSFSEIVWDLNSNLVLMGAASNTLCERIQEVFEATFDLKLRPMFPALIGGEYIAAQGLEQEYFAT